jgi:glycosyltransferase involved in cell wall biosynthesis
MIINIPIEPYEERYTKQWDRWFKEYFKVHSRKTLTVYGSSLTTEIVDGSVLDVYGTHYYKFDQLKKIVSLLKMKVIKSGDRLFFHDLWFPGIEGIAYIRDMMKLDLRITGVLHAGTYDRNDFTFKAGMSKWGRSIEQGWLNIFDEVYLGSEYHRQLIKSTFKSKQKALLLVTGLPFKAEEVDRSTTKENIVVFPHRLDEEKQPEKFEQLKQELSSLYPEWKFIRTKDVCKTKEEYYQLLGKSKIAVSYAKQETFGYAMLEAIANRCHVIVPNRLSYHTMDIYKNCRYDTTRMTDAVERAIQGKAKKQNIDLSEYSVENTLERMGL